MTNTAAAHSAPSPETIFATLTAYQSSAALRTAIDLGVFSIIGGGSASAAEIAGQCSASARGTRILCDYLATIGFLVKDGARYSNSPTSAVFLDRNQPAYMGGIARFLHDSTIMGPWQELTSIVRAGRTVLPGQGTVEPDNRVWVEFAESMGAMMGGAAPPVARLLLAEAAGPMEVLDIAAGHGLFGIEVARQNPHARVTALDWPAVLEVAGRNAAKAAVADRHRTLPGDAFATNFGGPYDVVLLTNFLHHFNNETCVNLLKKVRAALKPGGRAVTLEFVPDEGRTSPPVSAMFALTMLATTAEGDAYTHAELDAMHRSAGFARTTLHDLQPFPQRVVIGYSA